MRRAVWVSTLTAVLVAGGACTREPRLVSGQARLVPADDAEVLVAAPGRELDTTVGVRTLAAGTRVRVMSGMATIVLVSGDRLEFAGRSEVRLDDPPRLISGEVLLVPGTARPLTIEAGGSTIAALGPARVARDLAVTAASYRTGIRLDSAGQRLRIPPLRQASVASLGEVPGRADPIVYDPANPWDRLYLGDAVAMASELEARSRGFTSSLARGEGRTPGFYRLLLPVLEGEAGFGEVLLSAERPPGETLVGIAIALQGSGGTFETRFREVFDFRDAGADWGLVALDQGVKRAPDVVASVDQAIGRAPLAFAPPPSTRPPARPPEPEPFPLVPPVTAPPAPGPTSGRPGAATAPGGVGATDGTPPPVSPTPAVRPPPPPPLLTPVADLLAGLLPGLVTVEP
ncbi:MAG: hypothetical protein ACRD1K_14680 [Acidimicrobiales bacterium]